MMMLSKVIYWLLALVVSFAVGAIAGWQVKDRYTKAAQLDELAAVREVDIANVADAQAKDLALGKGIQLSRSAVASAKQEVVSYVVKRVKIPVRVTVPAECPAPVQADKGAPEQPVVAQPEARLLASDDVLPVGLVRLLNDARSGTFDPSTLPSDGEGKAPSAVEAQDFIESDFDVVAEYHELAKKHDELVEYVEKLQREQRARLGRSITPDLERK